MHERFQLINIIYSQVGFLYLRYVGNSKTLWGWYEQYIKDDEVCVSFIFIIDFCVSRGSGGEP